MKKMLFILTFVGIKICSFAQDSCYCCSAEQRAFDFWLGSWEVYDTNANWLGKNLVIQMQDSCLLQENWSSKGISGTSYNYYDKNDSSWHQLWIDSRGGILKLKGNLHRGAMIMQSEPMNSGDFHQISWTPLEDGIVVQHWLIKNKDGIVIKNLFYGIYKRDEDNH